MQTKIENQSVWHQF